MRSLTLRILPLLLSLFAAGCASRPLPKYEKPIARTQVQSVRTTAYTHTESDHTAYSNRNALGTTLLCGPIKSAAADWSRWPAGTVFRIRETGEVFRVDDYGWALSGTNTIDLYKPSRSAMNAWGVRRVTIENLEWGSVDRSLAILRTRSKYKHIRRMIDQIEDRYAELQTPVPTGTMLAAQPAPQVLATAPRIALAQPVAAMPVAEVRATATPRMTAGGVVLTPFASTPSR